MTNEQVDFKGLNVADDGPKYRKKKESAEWSG